MRIGILILAAGRQAGGPETYEVELIRALAGIDRENEFVVYCTSPQGAAAVGPLPANFACTVLEPGVRALSLAVTLPRRLSKDGIGFFHATYAPPPLPTRPFLFTMHCASNFAHPEFYPRFIRWRLNTLQRIALRRAASILCVSNFVAGYLREVFGIEQERLRAIYNGAGRGFFRPEPGEAVARVAGRFGIREPYLLYVGKLQSRKNVIGLIRAYAACRKEAGTRLKLVLAGKRVQTSEGIDDAIKTAGIRGEVIETGYIAPPSQDPDSPLPYLYAAARATILPSFYEGFGIPVIEAMACGSPVIASNTTSLPEIAGDASILVDPRSTDEMAAAIARVDNDCAMRGLMIERGLARAQLFTWQNCAKQTLEAYRALGQRE